MAKNLHEVPGQAARQRTQAVILLMGLSLAVGNASAQGVPASEDVQAQSSIKARSDIALLVGGVSDEMTLDSAKALLGYDVVPLPGQPRRIAVNQLMFESRIVAPYTKSESTPALEYIDMFREGLKERLGFEIVADFVPSVSSKNCLQVRQLNELAVTSGWKLNGPQEFLQMPSVPKPGGQSGSYAETRYLYKKAHLTLILQAPEASQGNDLPAPDQNQSCVRHISFDGQSSFYKP